MGSTKLNQMQEKILEKRIEKIKKFYPDATISSVVKSNQEFLPKQLGGKAKRFTLKGKIIHMEKVGNRLFCTINDGTGLLAVEMENMMLNVKIKQGQLFSIVCRLKMSPHGDVFAEARGITMLDDADDRLKELKVLPLEFPPKEEAGRACRNYWEESTPVKCAKLKMIYRFVFIVPSLYLILEPQLLKRLTFGSLGPMLGIIIFMLVFLTGRQKVIECDN